MRISIKAVRARAARALVASAVAVVVLGASAGAASAVPGPAAWTSAQWGATQWWGTDVPLTIQVGEHQPVTCGFAAFGHMLNGGPYYAVQGNFVGTLFNPPACFDTTSVVELAYKDGGEFWIAVEVDQIDITDSVGTWTVDDAAFEGDWENADWMEEEPEHPYHSILTFTPGTQIGTTTTGLPVTIAGEVIVENELQ